MTIQKYATAHWSGGLKDGKGTVSMESGALKDNPYGFNTRFDGQAGTNPEEMVAAAHAACFSMALSKVLGDAGMVADSIDTKATITLEQKDGGFAVTKSALELTLKVSGADQAKMKEAAEGAKAGCPISKLFNCEITLDATYQS